MSELTTLVQYLYSKFLMRDVLGKMVPGAIVLAGLFAGVTGGSPDAILYSLAGLSNTVTVFLVASTWVLGFVAQEMGTWALFLRLEVKWLPKNLLRLELKWPPKELLRLAVKWCPKNLLRLADKSCPKKRNHGGGQDNTDAAKAAVAKGKRIEAYKKKCKADAKKKRRADAKEKRIADAKKKRKADVENWATAALDRSDYQLQHREEIERQVVIAEAAGNLAGALLVLVVFWGIGNFWTVRTRSIILLLLTGIVLVFRHRRANELREAMQARAKLRPK